MKILILDDDAFTLSVLSAQLGKLDIGASGFDGVVVRSSGDDAIPLLSGMSDIGLVFCDLQMPGMDGIEFVRRLVELEYRGGLVLVSGESSRIIQAAATVARAHKLRVLGAVEKPIQLGTLKEILDACARVPEESRRKQHRSYSLDELRGAIATKSLVNHYQPKVSLLSGEVIGMEALVRWQHPRDGLVMPNDFIPLAEEGGVVTELGAVVMETALRDLHRWLAEGKHWEVAVNVSTRSFSNLDYPDQLAEQARRLGTPLEHIILEITESQMASDPKSQLDILTRLRLKGARLSIDDFGTGYSFLSQLRELPVEELKIDRSFVHGAWRDSQLGAIVDSNIRLARELGFRAIAEGVEDIEDWRFLQGVRCGFAQGYFIGRPMPAEALDEWLVGWNGRVADLVQAG